MRTLKELMAHIDSVYAPRNALVRSDLTDRMSFLDISVGKLHKAYRKGKKEEYGVRLANLFSRICCVAENFRGNLGFIEMLARKYPATHCTYCQQMPCVCKYEERNPSVLVYAQPAQLDWTLGDWQTHFAELYLAQNRSPDRGPNIVLLQIFGEVSELLEVAEEAPAYSMDKLTRLFAEELGDVFAWTIGFANLFGVPFEDSIEKVYGRGCPKCRRSMCKCSIFQFKVDRADTVTI